MSDRTTLNHDLQLVQSLFPPTHPVFQVTRCTLDELACNFIAQGCSFPIVGNIMENCLVMWCSEVEDSRITELLSVLSEKGEICLLKQVDSMLSSLCDRFGVVAPAELAQLQPSASAEVEGACAAPITSGTVHRPTKTESDEDADLSYYYMDDDFLSSQRVSMDAEGAATLDRLERKANELKKRKVGPTVGLGYGNVICAGRLKQELREMFLSDEVKKGVVSVELVNDNIFEWHVQLRFLDGNSDLSRDLMTLHKSNACEDFVLLHLLFKTTFPFDPPFVRVVSPVLASNGLVLDGGAISMEVLTKQGWSVKYSMQSVILQVSSALLDHGARVQFDADAETQYTLEKADQEFLAYSVKFASDDDDRFLANVHVWQAIFEMLSAIDRIRVEMTNKRLGMLMLEYGKRVTSFDNECLTGIDYGHPSTGKNGEKLSAPLLAICVDRIGDGLRSLTIREKFFPTTVWSATLPSIGEGCPNVETINFLFEDNDGTLDIRFDSFSQLKTLTVSGDSAGEDYFAKASASVFLSIPVSIEVIRGLEGRDEEAFENGAQMEGFFAHRPSLREVSLGQLFTRDESKADIFRVIAERCPHLQSIKLYSGDCIDYSGVVALESMKELRICWGSCIFFKEMEIVTICERSPLVQDLEFHMHLSSNIDLQSAALNAIGALTKLDELRLYTDWITDVVAPSLVTVFVRELARNSGASLRHLDISNEMPLPTAAIEALANGCPKLRHVEFGVRVDEAEPASIRFLIDCIVAHPSWIHQTGEPTLVICIGVMRGSGDEAETGLAAFKALAAPAANLPSGVELIIFEN